MIKIAIVRIFIHFWLHRKYHRFLVCNSVRLFALVASKDGERDGHKMVREIAKEKIFWETQAQMAVWYLTGT